MKRLLVLGVLLAAASCGSDPTTAASATQPEPIPTTVPLFVPDSTPTSVEAAQATSVPAEPTAAPTEPATAVPTAAPVETPTATATATPAPAEPTETPTAEPAPSDADLQHAALVAARARWQAARPTSYSMTYRLQCECDQGPWRVVVDGAGPGIAEHLGQAVGGFSAPYLSVEDIFNEIQATLNEGRFPVDVAYHDLGFPSTYVFNEPDLPIDGGFVVVMDEFVPNVEAEPGEDRAADRQLLADARARWASAGLADYDYTFRRVCFCPPESIGPYLTSVRGGAVVGATYEGVDLLDIEVLRIEQYSPQVLTVNQVFAEIERAIADAASYTVEYHPDIGYPTNMFIDWDERLADEEAGYQITDLAAPAG